MTRGAIWIKTLMVVAVYAAAIAAADRLLLSGLQRGLALALAFAIVQTAAIAVMLLVLLTRRGVAEARAGRSRRVAEQAATAIAEHAAGSDRLRVLRDLRGQSKRDVDLALLSFLTGMRGSMQERVHVLARDLGANPDLKIDREATASLFDRALLAHETRANAPALAQREIPRALASGDETSMIAALDLLRGWRLALEVANFEEAFTHPSAEVRRRAFLALPYVIPSGVEGSGRWSAPPAPPDPSTPLGMTMAGLRDESPLVRAAAASAAGKLRLAEAVPALEERLSDDYDVALAAAFALAMTPEGQVALQRRVADGNRLAFEAIEKATIGRLELA